MILDKKGKLFGKISIVDILVIVIVLVMCVGAFFTYQKISNREILTENTGLLSSSVSDSLEVTLRVSDVRRMTVDNIQKEDEVFFEDTGKYFGTITDVNTEPATKLIYDNKGNAIESEIPGKYDVLITMTVPGSRLDHGYYNQDNIRLVFGSEIKIKTLSIMTTPVIENIRVLSGE